MMRIAILLTVLTLSGCHLTGQSACDSAVEQQQACEGNCPDGSACRTCSHCSSGSEWLCRLTLSCCGRHPKYCRSHDNIMTRHDARKLAHREIRRTEDSRCVNCDFRMGYEQAFVDVSLGACGEVPALPPANYWTNCARTPGGHQKAQDWFNGYAAGAAAAKPLYEPYNKVAASQFYDGNCQQGMRGQEMTAPPVWNDQGYGQ